MPLVDCKSNFVLVLASAPINTPEDTTLKGSLVSGSAKTDSTYPFLPNKPSNLFLASLGELVVATASNITDDDDMDLGETGLGDWKASMLPQQQRLAVVTANKLNFMVALILSSIILFKCTSLVLFYTAQRKSSFSCCSVVSIVAMVVSFSFPDSCLLNLCAS